MPKLWNATIQAHRRDVREAIVFATAALVAEHGLRAVTMSQIAERTGIGRATLYKYFSDVEAIVQAWHAQQITAHLEHLTQVRDDAAGTDNAAGPASRLHAVLTAYALISHRTRQHQDSELATFLHAGEQLAGPQRQLHDLVTTLIEDGAGAGELRDDVTAAELASYCLHALTAATTAPDEAAVHRLVTVTHSGLQPPG